MLFDESESLIAVFPYTPYQPTACLSKIVLNVDRKAIGNNMKYKGMIFDLDGTLVDSMGVWGDVDIKILTKYGVKPPENLAELLKPMSFMQSTDYFINVLGVDAEPDELLKEMYDVVIEDYLYHIPAKEDAYEFVKRQHSEGVKLCVATATNIDLAEGCLKRLGMFEFFDFIVTCDQLETGKDRPDIYHYCAKQFGLKPGKIMVFEDAVHSAKTAKEAGYCVVGIYEKLAEDDMPALMKLCDYFIRKYADLEKVLQ